MTISSETRKAGPFVGNGVTTVFPFVFKVFVAGDVSVTRLTVATGVQTLLVLSTDYTIALNVDQNTNPGGSVTYNPSGVPLPATQTLTLGSVVPRTQGTHLLNGGDYFANNIEDMADRATIVIQQEAERVSRSLKFPITDSAGLSAELPAVGLRANTTLGFDASGNVLLGAVASVVVSAAMTPVVQAATTAAAAAALAVLPLAGGTMTGGIVQAAGASIASATAVNLTTATGNTVVITGTTTSTSLTMSTGQQMILLPSGAWPLTYHATTMNINGGVSYTCAAGDRLYCVKDSAGVIRVTVLKQDGTAVVAGGSVLRSYLAGLTLSTAGSSATMSIAAGVATDSTNAASMSLAAFSKTTGTWALGAAAGGLDTGTIANSSWYHFFLIQRTDTGVVDVLISLSATAPTMPTSYTLFRRIGAGRTNGSAQWTSFVQLGDEFLWAVTVLDVSATGPGNTAVLRTLTVPTGVQVISLARWSFYSPQTGTDVLMIVTSPDETDQAPSSTATPLANMAQVGGDAGRANTLSSVVGIRTNTSGQVRSRAGNSAGSDVLSGATYGWVDTRGRDA